MGLFAATCFSAPAGVALAQEDTTAPPAAPATQGAAPAPTSGRFANAPQEVAPRDPRPFYLVPSLGVQESFTDNVFLTQDNREFDAITRFTAGVDAKINSARTTATLTALGAYDLYAKNNDFNGFSTYAYGSGAYWILPQTLSLELDGSTSNGNISTFGASAIDRSGTAGRFILSTYYVGPHLTVPVGNFADLNAAARFQQVFYTGADNSQIAPGELPQDSNVGQIVGRLDTGTRFRRYQAVTSFEYDRDNHDYYTYNAVQSLFFSVAPRVRLIARAGYEQVYQTDVVDISAPILLAGVEYSPNDRSKISFEGGQRYNRASWAANASVQVSNRFYLIGSYTERLEPNQAAVAGAFVDYVAAQNELPAPITPPAFRLTGNFYDETSLNKLAEAHVVYQTPRQTIDTSIAYNNSLFIRSQERDRTLIAQVDYRRNLRADLVLNGRLEYDRTFASPVFGASDTYFVSTSLSYRVNRTVEFDAGYDFTWGREDFVGGDTVYENVIYLGLRKTF